MHAACGEEGPNSDGKRNSVGSRQVRDVDRRLADNKLCIPLVKRFQEMQTQDKAPNATGNRCWSSDSDPKGWCVVQAGRWNFS